MPSLNRLQKYDLAGGSNGIDAEFSLPPCTSSELLNDRDFRKYVDKFRKEHALRQYGAEDAKIRLPFAEDDRDYALYLWDARKYEQDVVLHYSRRSARKNWTLGHFFGRAMLEIHELLPVVQTRDYNKKATTAATAAKQPPTVSLTHKQKGEWLLTVIEYDTHLRQKGMS